MKTVATKTLLFSLLCAAFVSTTSQAFNVSSYVPASVKKLATTKALTVAALAVIFGYASNKPYVNEEESNTKLKELTKDFSLKSLSKIELYKLFINDYFFGCIGCDGKSDDDKKTASEPRKGYGLVGRTVTFTQRVAKSTEFIDKLAKLILATAIIQKFVSEA